MTEPVFKWIESLAEGTWSLYEFPYRGADRIEPAIGVVTHRFIYKSSKTMTDKELQENVIRAFVVPLPDRAFWNRPTPEDWARGIGDDRYPMLPRT